MQTATSQLTTGAAIYSHLTRGGGLVFVVDDSGVVTALAQEDLGYRWSVDLGDPIRKLAVAR